ncbi:MAG TPA: hypothetical protein VF257_11530, partial [Solirubrobacteraceae bacterium]
EDGPVGIESVKAADGKVLAKNRIQSTPVLQRKLADETVSIMTTVISQGTGRRAALGPGQFAAGKTGTTENSGDAWFVGFSDRLTVAVWVGYADMLKPMLTEFAGQPVEGGTFPALIWHDFMVAATNIVNGRRAKERARKGLPPLPESDQQTSPVPATVVPTKPSPVPEGGDTAPAVPEATSPPANGTGAGSGSGTPTNGTGSPSGNGNGNGPTTPGAGSGGAGGTSAPEG